MDNLHKLSRIILIGIGVYILLQIACSLSVTVIFVFLSAFSKSFEEVFMLFITLLSYVAFAVLVIFFLIKKADYWAEKIVGPKEQENELPLVFWVPAALRLTVIFAGIICMFWLIPDIISTFYRIFIYRQQMGVSMDEMFDVRQLIKWIIQFAAVIYLLFGAPHFVKWHIQKILEKGEGGSKTTNGAEIV